MKHYTESHDINAWVDEALTELNFTASWFANYCGAHRNSVGNWRKPGRPVPEKAVIALQKLLDKQEEKEVVTKKKRRHAGMESVITLNNFIHVSKSKY